MARTGFEQEYAFRCVELFKTEALGTGGYGVVCKAKCDQLLCAAKLLYPVLFQTVTPDRGKEHRQPMARFEMECKFMSQISHPNVVQYLGTYRDPDTGAPVLLMELMDESLTHFLENSPGDIPYHTQVNLSYDIAQALAFLHANGIIHRDLSSNNVLLLAKRAKVTDFGMSRFDTNFASLTKCPGTPPFMPPEALSSPPRYTEKMDNFSLGVLILQIITRNFPRPTDQFETRELVDPKDPGRKLKAKLPVPESQRRREDLDLVEDKHPLLPIILECLSDEDPKRPAAGKLCMRFAVLKELDRYICSVRNDKEQLLSEKRELISDQNQIITAQKTEIESLKDIIQTIGNDDVKVTELSEKLEQKETIVTSQADTIAHINSQIKSQRDDIKELRLQLQRKDEQLLTVQGKLEEKEKSLQNEQRKRSKAMEGEVRPEHRRMLTDQFDQQNMALEYTRQHTYPPADKQTGSLEPADNSLLFKTFVNTNSEAKTMPPPASPPVMAESRRTASNTDIYTLPNELPSKVKAQAPAIQDSPTTPKTPPNVPSVAERRPTMHAQVPPAPILLKAGSAAVCGTVAYFRGAGGKLVFKFDLSHRKWKRTDDHPLYGFTLVNVQGKLVTAGGFERNESSGKLYELGERGWVENLPEMPVKSDRPIAVCAIGHLIVAGGYDSLSQPLHTVFALNLETQQWIKAASLPIPVPNASAAVCGDRLYVSLSNTTKHHSVLSCTLAELVKPKKSIRRKFMKPEVWTSLADLPVSQACLTNGKDRLLAIGGIRPNDKTSNRVYVYNKANNAWESVARMSIGRSSCMGVVFNENLLIVVGGHKVITKDVETIIINLAL